MPIVTAVFCASGAKRGVVLRWLASLRRQSSYSGGVARAAPASPRSSSTPGTAPTARASVNSMKPAARSTCAPAPRDHGVPCRPWRSAPPQQRVVAGVELHLVDAVAEAVVRVQLRRVHVGQPRVRLHLGAARLRRRAPTARCASSAGRLNFSASRSARLVVEQVDVDERRALVDDLVRGCVHAGTPSACPRGGCRRRGIRPTRSRSRGADRSAAGAPAR